MNMSYMSTCVRGGLRMPTIRMIRGLMKRLAKFRHLFIIVIIIIILVILGCSRSFLLRLRGGFTTGGGSTTVVRRDNTVTELSELSVDLLALRFCGFRGVLKDLRRGELLFVESSRLDFALSLELFNEVVVTPSSERGEVAQSAELAVRLQADVLDGTGDNELLHLVERMRASLHDLQAVHGGLSLGLLVGNHTTDNPPEDAGRRTVVEGTLLRVRVHSLLQEGVVFEFVAEEGSRDVDLLTSDNNHSLSSLKLLGKCGSKATEKVPLSVNDDNFFKHHCATLLLRHA
mmetsp:Transcript_20281/g.38156  ORF Transcript_20281/g.38156 Transcript_20281/m.38156 type:complete len:288 (+) Transcript_20281:35-898(+)